MSDSPFQATIKPPAQWRDAPWINIQATDETELAHFLTKAFPTSGEQESLSAIVAAAYLEYSSVLNVTLKEASGVVNAPQAASIQSDGPAPQWATAAPAAANGAPPAPQCQHGERQFKSGQGAKGPWKAWMCAAAKGDPTKCEPQWLR